MRDDVDSLQEFTRFIFGFYEKNRRPMPWRDHISPYWVVVSEIMLQQTQVERVIGKFPEFINKFPNFTILSSAPAVDLFEAWQGLGYNRRARYLQNLARKVLEGYGGELPRTVQELLTLPGIGNATAGSIMAFAYNEPVVFIETNIRRVFIHHFFSGSDEVPDSDILPLVALTLSHQNPREWYYALMDYGSWLKNKVSNPNRRSRHYSRQSAFEGSDRQIRGRIIQKLVQEKVCKSDDLAREAEDLVRGGYILQKMIKEGLICESDQLIRFSEKI